MATQIMVLNEERDWAAVYATQSRGAYKTPMIFDGTLDDCIRWRVLAAKLRGTRTVEEEFEFRALCEKSPSCRLKGHDV